MFFELTITFRVEVMFSPQPLGFVRWLHILDFKIKPRFCGFETFITGCF